MNVLLVYREREYSPGKVRNDSEILDKCGIILRRMGWSVTITAGESLPFIEVSKETDVILAMCQGMEALDKLSELSLSGTIVINTPMAVRNCFRKNMLTKLREFGIMAPNFELLDTTLGYSYALPSGRSFWIKRPDYHAILKGDVAFIQSGPQRVTVIDSLIERGIKQIIVQEHIEGRLIKCYAVSGSTFFSCYPQDNSDGVEDRIKLIVERIAEYFRLQVFGVDFILASQNTLMVIDVNDWPSFSVCSDEAASAICHHVQGALKLRRPILG